MERKQEEMHMIKELSMLKPIIKLLKKKENVICFKNLCLSK